MVFYRYICDSDEYHSLELPESVPTSWLVQWNGSSFRDSWSPIRLNVYQRNARGNFPHLSGNLPVFDEKAWNGLKPLIGNYVEALPLEKPEQDWPKIYLINVTTILDCLDYKKADVDRFEEGLVLNIRHYAFRSNIVKQTPIFRIKDCELYTVIVSSAFREVVESKQLKGLLWKTLP